MPALSAQDIRNVFLHLADFHYILEEFKTLHSIKSLVPDIQDNDPLLASLRENIAKLHEIILQLQRTASQIHREVMAKHKQFISFVSQASKRAGCFGC